MSSQHDEAPARPDESGLPARPEQSAGSVPDALPPASPVPSSPAADGPTVASAAGHGQVSSPGTKAPRGAPWKRGADGRTVFRRSSSLVIFWVWVAFAIYNAAQIAIPDHDYFSLELGAGLLAVTALVYACTLRPGVIADDGGVTVHNPFRDHRIRWGALNGVYLGDSVELACARPAPRKEKTIYCWALYSGRRSRMRSRMRAERDRTRTYGTGAAAARRASADAQELAKQDIVHLMAAEIGRQSTDAKERGVPNAVLESGWAWLPLVYLLVPVALLLGLVLGR